LEAEGRRRINDLQGLCKEILAHLDALSVAGEHYQRGKERLDFIQKELGKQGNNELNASSIRAPQNMGEIIAFCREASLSAWNDKGARAALNEVYDQRIKTG